MQVVHEGRAASLKRAKLAVDTVGKGAECGLLLDGWDGCQVAAAVVCAAQVHHLCPAPGQPAAAAATDPRLYQSEASQQAQQGLISATHRLVLQAGDTVRCFTVETRAARSHEVVQQLAATG